MKDEAGREMLVDLKIDVVLERVYLQHTYREKKKRHEFENGSKKLLSNETTFKLSAYFLVFHLINKMYASYTR